MKDSELKIFIQPQVARLFNRNLFPAQWAGAMMPSMSMSVKTKHLQH